MVVTIFYKEKEREHFFKECINQKPQFFKASLEAPEEISRKRREEAGVYAGGRLAGFLTGACSLLCLCLRKIILCVLLRLFLLPIWISGLKGQICKVFDGVLSFVNCDLKMRNFHGGSVKIIKSCFSLVRICDILAYGR